MSTHVFRDDDLQPPLLEPLLRTAPWMPRDLRAAHRWEAADHAELGSGELLLVVAAVGGPASGERIFLTARRDPLRREPGTGRPRRRLPSASVPRGVRPAREHGPGRHLSRSSAG
ncbi:hypothetical protein, partial [Streptomyces eurythermus]